MVVPSPEQVTEVKAWAEALLNPDNWPGIAYDAATTRGAIVSRTPTICTSWLAMFQAIKEAHAAHGDDRCWIDMDKIMAAAGLPVPDRRVGCKVSMLENCKRFLDVLCDGGHWKSYAELEGENADLRARIERLEADNHELNEHLAEVKQIGIERMTD